MRNIEPDIFICAVGKTNSFCWGFYKTAAGQLDYCGKIENNTFTEKDKSVDIKGFEKLDASPYFSSAWYTYLCDELCCNINIYLKDSFEITDSDSFAFITHIGALLLAVELEDSLLVAELLARRTEVFMKFAQLTLFIIKPVAPQALFVWLYGKLHSDEDLFKTAYYKNTMFAGNNTEVSSILFCAAKESLKPNPHNEKPEQMFIRYFKDNKVKLTIGIVGSSFHSWDCGIDLLDKCLDKNLGDDILQGTSKVSEAKKNLYKNLKVSVQAEPYNKHDRNAISVCIESIYDKANLNASLQRAGYIRATGAAILRSAKPAKFNFKAKLVRIGNLQDGKNGVVVQLDI